MSIFNFGKKKPTLLKPMHTTRDLSIAKEVQNNSKSAVESLMPTKTTKRRF
jgi:hypothetical protein